jgi:hypothetical protein
MTGKEASGLIEIISRIIEGRRGEARISPSWVATEGMQELRAGWMREPNNGYPLVYIGCHLQLRQIARGVLRERFEPELDEGETVQHPFFLACSGVIRSRMLRVKSRNTCCSIY